MATIGFVLGLALTSALGSRLPAAWLVFAALCLLPCIVGEAGLWWCAIALVVAERRVMAWVGQGPQRAEDDRGVRWFLLGPRASWIGCLALANVSGLAICAALAAWIPVDGVRVLQVPSWLIGAGCCGLAIALAWGLADLPLTRRERTALREMCAPGDIQPKAPATTRTSRR